MTRLRVRELAEAQGLNITTLSQKAQLSYTSVLHLWHDRADQYNRKTLDRIAVTLGVTVSELFAGQPEDTREKDRGNSLPMLLAA